MAGGDIGRSCEIAVRHNHFDCFLIAWKYGGKLGNSHHIAKRCENAKVLEWYANNFDERSAK